MDADGSVSAPEPATGHMGLANGLFFDAAGDRILYTDTLVTAGSLVSDGKGLQLIYRKTSMKEAFDDLCTDSRGRIWMTGPVNRSLKVYEPVNDKLIRYEIDGFGQASSCRIRVENGEEILYVTELVVPERDRKNRFNGRGVLRVPLGSFPE